MPDSAPNILVQALMSRTLQPHSLRTHCMQLLPVLQVEGLGIASAAQLFTDFGYKRRDAFEFPAKKLRVGHTSQPSNPCLPSHRLKYGVRHTRAAVCSSPVRACPLAPQVPASTFGPTTECRCHAVLFSPHPHRPTQAYWFSPPDPELPRVFISELKVRPEGHRLCGGCGGGGGLHGCLEGALKGACEGAELAPQLPACRCSPAASVVAASQGPHRLHALGAPLPKMSPTLHPTLGVCLAG